MGSSVIPRKFKARFDLFRWAVKGKSQSVVPPQGMGEWLREARRRVYESCDYHGDCCKSCDDQRLLDIFFLRFWTPDKQNSEIVEDFFEKYSNPDIFHLGSYCDEKDRSSKSRPSMSPVSSSPSLQTSRSLPSNISVSSSNNSSASSLSFMSNRSSVSSPLDAARKRNASTVISPVPNKMSKPNPSQSPSNNPNKLRPENMTLEQKRARVEVEMDRLRMVMKSRKRQFGKDITYKPWTGKILDQFEKEDVKFLHELLISYSAEDYTQLEERISKITPHFAGKFPQQIVKKRVLKMMNDYGPKSSLFNHKQEEAKDQPAPQTISKPTTPQPQKPPTNNWGYRDFALLKKMLKQTSKDDPQRNEKVIKAFNGKFPTELINSKISAYEPTIENEKNRLNNANANRNAKKNPTRAARKPEIVPVDLDKPSEENPDSETGEAVKKSFASKSSPATPISSTSDESIFESEVTSEDIDDPMARFIPMARKSIFAREQQQEEDEVDNSGNAEEEEYPDDLPEKNAALESENNNTETEA